jgi:hypothetical protein
VPCGTSNRTAQQAALGFFHVPSAADLMNTFQQTAVYQRMTRISRYPFETARAISAEQFRPTEKASDVIERDTATDPRNR